MDDILGATKGTGVDVVVNSSQGELSDASWQCVAEFGSLVNIGPGDHGYDEIVTPSRAKRNVTRIDVDLRHASRHRLDVLARLATYSFQTVKEVLQHMLTHDFQASCNAC